MKPSDLKFTKTHEWARYDVDGETVTVGISAYAVEQLGDIVFVELPAAGETVAKDQPFGTIESVKAAVNLQAPVSGEVIAVNDDVMENFDQIAESPYADGWMIQIRPADPDEVNTLMDEASYKSFLDLDSDTGH